jgi:activator of 2-hydroxyglutaryl-CoA dehydratase
VIVEVCGYWEIGKKGAEEFEEEKKLIVKIRGKDRKVLNFDETHIYL